MQMTVSSETRILIFTFSFNNIRQLQKKGLREQAFWE